jgi:hypothetical protein
MPMAKTKLKSLGFVNSLTSVFKMDFNKEIEKEELSEKRKPSTKRARSDDEEDGGDHDKPVQKKLATASAVSASVPVAAKPSKKPPPEQPEAVQENFKTIKKLDFHSNYYN